MRVVVAGGTGGIGSALAEKLACAGASVTILFGGAVCVEPDVFGALFIFESKPWASKTPSLVGGRCRNAFLTGTKSRVSEGLLRPRPKLFVVRVRGVSGAK